MIVNIAMCDVRDRVSFPGNMPLSIRIFRTGHMCEMCFIGRQGGFDNRDDYIGFMKEHVKANQSLSSALHFVNVAGKRYRQFDDVTDRLSLLGKISRISLDDERRPPDLQKCVQAFSSITLYVNELRKVTFIYQP